jgi:carbamoyl-phosphate synthase large subunit
MAKPTIIVTGCGGIPAQNVAWCLRSRGDYYRIVGVECDHYRVFLTTGFDRKYLVPRAEASHYVSVLNDIIQAEDAHFVHPQPDAEVAVLSAQRERIRAQLMLPERSVVELCHDKFELIKKLHERRIPAARHLLVRNGEDVKAAMDTFGPKLWLRAIRGSGGRGSLAVEALRHAEMWIDYWDGWGSFVAEEYLPGRNLAWQGVYQSGDLVGSIAWERLAYVIPQASPSGITGTPAVARLVCDEDVHRIGRQVVKAIDSCATGIFGVDLKANCEGTPYVTEVNPGRFFQPSFMYAHYGYNLVGMFFDVALGRAQPGDFDVQARASDDSYWLRGIDVSPVCRRFEGFPKAGHVCE